MSRRLSLLLMLVFLLPLLSNNADAAAGDFLFNFGSQGSGNGQFNSPEDVAVNQEGTIYVVDMSNHRIQIFNSTGAYVGQWGSYGTGNGQFNLPHGIAMDGDSNVYVADTNNCRIQIFNSTGAYVDQWGSYGTAEGYFAYPNGVAVDSSGNVYVADTSNHRVQAFDSSHNVLWTSGSYGSGDGQFNQPWGVAVDDTFDNIYVADMGNHRVQVLNSIDGQFKSDWGAWQFWYPKDVDVDALGYVYVVDAQSRVNLVTSSGTLIDYIGGGYLYYPYGVGIGGLGSVYVADTGNYKIQVFDAKDTINIITADYQNGDKLLVEATSNYGASANLELLGFGPMDWDSTNSVWTLLIKHVGGDPGSVTVFGPEGVEYADTY